MSERPPKPSDITIAFTLPAGPSIGGVEGWSIDTARRLSARGRKPVLLEYPVPADGREGGLPMPNDVPGLRCTAVGWGELNPANQALYRSTLPAVFFPNWSREAFAICAALSREHAEALRVVGVCHTFQGYYFELLTFYEPILHRIIAVSEECADVLRERLPHRAADIEVRLYPVEAPERLERTCTSSGQPLRLLYAGRIVEAQKRVSDLLRLASELDRLQVDFRLRIVGEGSAKPRLVRMLRHLPAGLRARISLEPALPHHAVAALLRETDVAVLVSSYEGTSIFMLEAMANGCVPVVTAVSGTKALIEEGVSGYRIPLGDLPGMASRLAALAADRDQLPRLGTAARAAALRCTHASYLDWLERLLDDVWTQSPRRWPDGRRLFRWYQTLAGQVERRIPYARAFRQAALRYWRG